MDKNAKMVLTQYRALRAKPAELKKVVKLPMKRARSVYQASSDFQISLSEDDVSDLLKLLYNMLTSELESSQMKKLEKEFQQKVKEILNTEELQAKLPKLQNSLKYLITEFDMKKEDSRTERVLQLLKAEEA